MPLHAVQVPIAAPRSAPEDDQGRRGRRRRAERRRDTEARDADHEDAHVAVDVAERPADEDERAERQQIGVDDPLLRRDPAAEIRLDRRQRHVDDRPVDEHDRCAENRGDDREAGGPAREARPGRSGRRRIHAPILCRGR